MVLHCEEIVYNTFLLADTHNGGVMESGTKRFWLGWTVATLAGYIIAIIILLPIAVNLAYMAQLPIVIGLASGAILGACTGLGQWIILRRGTPISIGWVGASIIGGMLGMAFGMMLETSVLTTAAAPDATREAAALIIPWRVAWQTGVAGALFGLGMGLGQYWFLRQYVRDAAWWIATCGAAWMIGLGAGAALAELITTLGALLVTGLIAAAITAYIMEQWQWELHKRTGPIPGRL
jgi:hypothetical protein